MKRMERNKLKLSQLKCKGSYKEIAYQRKEIAYQL